MPFVDLNHDDVHTVPLRSWFTALPELALPQAVLDADVVVSMPKLKTHHWAGVTCSMKNLFGVVPGAVYGWPKNVLHFRGIDESILDIVATVRPHLAIVDGVVGMEGDGPIMGRAKAAGVVLMGRDVVAVDASAARVMGLRPEGVALPGRGGAFLGNLDVGAYSDARRAPGALRHAVRGAAGVRGAPGMSRSHFLRPALEGQAPWGLRIEQSGDWLATRAEIAGSSRSRRKGLLGREALPRVTRWSSRPTQGVHTFGMRFPIDVVGVGRDGTVVSIRAAVPRRQSGVLLAGVRHCRAGGWGNRLSRACGSGTAWSRMRYRSPATFVGARAAFWPAASVAAQPSRR